MQKPGDNANIATTNNPYTAPVINGVTVPAWFCEKCGRFLCNVLLEKGVISQKCHRCKHPNVMYR